MVQKLLYSLNIRSSVFLLFSLFLIQNLISQELFIGSGSEFYKMKNTEFTTSNSVVTVDPSGTFSLEAGNDWGSGSEFVNGEIKVIGSGDTKIPTGNNGVYAPVNAIHTGDITAAYFNTSPTSGANGVDVDAVADIEYWELTGNAIITLPWNDNSGITSLVNNNGGKLGSVTIVGYDNGIWNLVSASQSSVVSGNLLNGDVASDANTEVNLNGFSQFTFGIDHQVVLSINELFLTNGINILSNPIKSFDNNIRFNSENELNDLQISLYDITGRQLKVYENISTHGRIGVIEKPNLRSGIYLLKFVHEGKQGVKKIIIE